jgi:hypothetical protein
MRESGANYGTRSTEKQGQISWPDKISGPCAPLRLRAHSAMHKDKPPGIFDLNERSLRYAVGFCFVVGFVLSVLVRIGLVLAREHFSQPTPWSGF